MTRKRMETADNEFLAGSLDFIERAQKAGKPFFIWHNSTRMHVWTRLSPKWEGKTGYGLYADGMADHDSQVGKLLDKLDELGIADNTIVVYTTDNGAEVMSWPDGGTIPFKGEKGTTWEGGFRVPAMVRWPGVAKPGTIINDIFSMEDWIPTLMAAAGEPDIKEKLLKGHEANGERPSRFTLTATTRWTCSPVKGPVRARRSSTSMPAAISMRFGIKIGRPTLRTLKVT